MIEAKGENDKRLQLKMSNFKFSSTATRGTASYKNQKPVFSYAKSGSLDKA